MHNYKLSNWKKKNATLELENNNNILVIERMKVELKANEEKYVRLHNEKLSHEQSLRSTLDQSVLDIHRLKSQVLTLQEHVEQKDIELKQVQQSPSFNSSPEIAKTIRWTVPTTDTFTKPQATKRESLVSLFDSIKNNNPLGELLDDIDGNDSNRNFTLRSVDTLHLSSTIHDNKQNNHIADDYEKLIRQQIEEEIINEYDNKLEQSKHEIETMLKNKYDEDIQNQNKKN